MNTLHIGKIAREIREGLHLTQHEMASAIGVTNVHISNIENDKSFPSQQIIDRYREQSGVDIYVLAWCLHGDIEKLPQEIQGAARRLARALQGQLRAFVGGVER